MAGPLCPTPGLYDGSRTCVPLCAPRTVCDRWIPRTHRSPPAQCCVTSSPHTDARILPRIHIAPAKSGVLGSKEKRVPGVTAPLGAACDLLSPSRSPLKGSLESSPLSSFSPPAPSKGNEITPMPG
ncbi:integral membrane protein GPR137B [Platysternon megacephalum]|uniref:Integral membrane protein GPR137B n=1 Tax=Platysternon megacephalum TaxID=55544 RepID=A0A4D9EUD1_9SAUR|nr:integral membrane protein GPR137B [Platysternon megacephalum]